MPCPICDRMMFIPTNLDAYVCPECKIAFTGIDVRNSDPEDRVIPLELTLEQRKKAKAQYEEVVLIIQKSCEEEFGKKGA